MFDQILGGVPTPLKLFMALAAVIALIVIAAWLTKRFGGQRLGAVAMAGRSRQPRLGVLDVLAVDGRRRLVIVRRDNVEHLVMIGGPNDLVVESGILRIPSGGSATTQREATTVVAQREPSAALPEAAAARPTPQPQLQPVAPTRVAPPIPTPATPPQPLRAVEQPVRAPRSVEAPPIVPSPSMTAAPFTPPPPPSKGPAAPKPAPLPTAPTIPNVAPAAVQPTSPAPAAPPAPVESAPVRPAPSPVPASSVAATPAAAPSPARPAATAAAGAARVSGIASTSDIAERLAAALKRPVAPSSRAPEAAKPEPAKPEPVKPEPVKPEPADEPEIVADAETFMAKDDDYAAPEIIAPAHDPDEAAAPEVKPEQRPALADATAPAEDDGDPFSLEADLAALLGRDMGKSKT